MGVGSCSEHGSQEAERVFEFRTAAGLRLTVHRQLVPVHPDIHRLPDRPFLHDRPVRTNIAGAPGRMQPR